MRENNDLEKQKTEPEITTSAPECTNAPKTRFRNVITFGSNHLHKLGQTVVDNNVLVIVEGDSYEANRATAFELFGSKFSMEYPLPYFKEDSMHYYPRGCIDVNGFETTLHANQEAQ